jgi:hypothetical protein
VSFISVNDTISVTSFPNITIDYVLSVADTTIATDSFAINVLSGGLSVFDTTTVTDSTSLTVSAPRINLQESHTASDSTVVVVNSATPVSIAASDSSTATDTTKSSVSSPNVNVSNQIVVFEGNIDLEFLISPTAIASELSNVQDATNIAISAKPIIIGPKVPILPRPQPVLTTLWLYLARRDNKGIRILAMLTGRPQPATRVPDIDALNLPATWEHDINKIVTDQAMLWEPWIESANTYDDLRASLKRRNYTNIPQNGEPEFNSSALDTPPLVSTNALPKTQTMVRKG